jgi:hypothetical protein
MKMSRNKTSLKNTWKWHKAQNIIEHYHITSVLRWKSEILKKSICLTAFGVYFPQLPHFTKELQFC